MAETMAGVSRYYMTAQTTYEHEMLLREVVAALRSRSRLEDNRNV